MQTREEKRTFKTLQTCKTLEWLSEELKAYFLEPTRGPYRKPKNVKKKMKGLKTTRRGKNRKQTNTEKQGRQNTLKLLKNM
jgi:hypothetical protein